jgi:hypothetical protein
VRIFQNEAQDNPYFGGNGSTGSMQELVNVVGAGEGRRRRCGGIWFE